MPIWLMALEAAFAGLQALAPVAINVVNAIEQTHPAAAPAAAGVQSLIKAVENFGSALDLAKAPAA